jgi:hypothetical protein
MVYKENIIDLGNFRSVFGIDSRILKKYLSTINHGQAITWDIQVFFSLESVMFYILS